MKKIIITIYLIFFMLLCILFGFLLINNFVYQKCFFYSIFILYKDKDTILVPFYIYFLISFFLIIKVYFLIWKNKTNIKLILFISLIGPLIYLFTTFLFSFFINLYIFVDNINYIREPKIIHIKPIVNQGFILNYENNIP